MQVKGSYSFFLGSNSGGGFRSYFSSFYDAPSMRRVYLLKGGPGNGKSTQMKKIAAAAIRQKADKMAQRKAEKVRHEKNVKQGKKKNK